MHSAETLLQSVQGKNLSEEERIEQSIRLAAIILQTANQGMTSSEKAFQEELAALVRDPVGKVFTTELADQAFRSDSHFRAASQIAYLLKKYGIPPSFSGVERLGMRALQILGPRIFAYAIPLLKRQIRKRTERVILPGEEDQLKAHLIQRQAEGVSTNLNHLGEAILGEEEAEKRLQIYLNDLHKPEVECISVKASTLYSQINLLAWEETLKEVSVRFRQLLRAAAHLRFKRRDGTLHPKFVNLDMEEYKDLHLTVALFKKVLEETEFRTVSAGIALQSYIPDSYAVLQNLTEWALQRTLQQGAPIKIRLVKGANLAMETVEASLKCWPSAPYETKMETDKNFKRMLHYSLDPEKMPSVHIGVGSHNLFDIAYALILTAEKNLQDFVIIEMLEGMAEHLRREVQRLTQDMLLYCPAAKKEEFPNAVAYLIRRLDENTGPENFLRFSFGLAPDSNTWKEQAGRFAYACEHRDEASSKPRRTQNRFANPEDLDSKIPFQNEPDTDWSLASNCLWIKKAIKEWKAETLIPAIIGGVKISESPMRNDDKPYRIPFITASDVNTCIKTAQKTHLPKAAQRSEQLFHIASLLRKARGKLIVSMMSDTFKTIPEADVEVSEAIDFAEYYGRSLHQMKSLQDLKMTPKGVILVTSPWNFPCSIPAGGILAALAGGNTVIFKPAPEAILVGYELVKIFWEAGILKQELQFVPCNDETASEFVKDQRVNAMILTGGTSTARMLLEMRPGLDLMAETGGKNSIIVTAMADRDLAIKDIVQSAFGYSGQKCSACSLLILEKEVFEDRAFREHLKDAAASLKIGSPWDLQTKINPLIRPPTGAMDQAINTLEPKETWLLKPKVDSKNPRLLSPGIKWGVKRGSFMHTKELFGPVLAVMKAQNLKEAIAIANATPYGLTAGLHSLDEREHLYWLEHIQAGNCYINRGITGAIVERQPFGGIKDSSFGPGAKAGGPNYLFQMMHIAQKKLPEDRAPLSDEVENLIGQAKTGLSEDELSLLDASARSYSFYWKHFFSKKHDPLQRLGQDNIQFYRPKEIVVRINPKDSWLDVLRISIACKITDCKVNMSIDPERKIKSPLGINIFRETEQAFVERISKKTYVRVRLLSQPSCYLIEKISQLGFWTAPAPVLANGRVELLHYLREISLSYDYHRYGYLGARGNQ